MPAHYQRHRKLPAVLNFGGDCTWYDLVEGRDEVNSVGRKGNITFQFPSASNLCNTNGRPGP